MYGRLPVCKKLPVHRHLTTDGEHCARGDRTMPCRAVPHSLPPQFLTTSARALRLTHTLIGNVCFFFWKFEFCFLSTVSFLWTLTCSYCYDYSVSVKIKHNNNTAYKLLTINILLFINLLLHIRGDMCTFIYLISYKLIP